MEQKKVNKEVENKRLEEFKRKITEDVIDELPRWQRAQLRSGVRYVEVSGVKDACMVKLRMDWKCAVTWLVVPLWMLIVIAIGVVLSPLIVVSVIFVACKRVLSDKVVDCVTIPEIGEE